MSPFCWISVMLANNETGVIQPIRELAEDCRAAGVPLHTDAVQAVGKIPVNFRELGVAAMTIAAHKFGGPRGIGALIVRGGAPIEPQLFGGVQQGGLRPGTEPVALAAGMHAALRTFVGQQDERIVRITQFRDRMEAALLAAWPSAVIHGADSPRLPNTTCIAFPGLDRQALVMALDLAGVCCSTGSACASGSSEPSPTLLAMGLSDELVGSSVRFSLGATTTMEMIDEAAQRITRVLQTQRLLRHGHPAKTTASGAAS
jgi:cysteine desulfurase